MAKESTNINLNPTLKKKAQELLKAIPFEIKRDVFNAEILTTLE